MSKRNFAAATIGGIVFITADPMPLPNVQQVGKTNTFVQAGRLDSFRDWLSNTEVAVAAEELDVSYGKIMRLRAALGLVEPYTGDSRTTAWRRKK